MSSSLWMPQVRRAIATAAAIVLAASVASAQSTDATDQPAAVAYSSSRSGLEQLDENALPSAPEAGGSAKDPSEGGQYGGGEGRNNNSAPEHGIVHRLTFEGGLGFNAPISTSITYGFNFTAGGGLRFNRNFSTLVEFQFIDDKLPGALISETNGEATGGHSHIWSFTVDPVYDFLPKASNDFYVTGGGGFYRKTTSFTFPEPTEFCSYFYCGEGYAPGTVGEFTSNQAGFNVGGGYLRRFNSMYGDESHTAIFVEVRYLDVLSPAIVGISPPGSGLPPVTINKDTEMIPITFGVRW